MAVGHLRDDIGAALVASSSIPLATNWADHVRTRMQGTRAAGSTCAPYSGLLPTTQRIVAEEGVLALCTTGIAASLARESVTQLFRTGLYMHARDALSVAAGGSGGAESSVAVKFATGLCLGAASALFASPLDLVRVRLQTEAGRRSADGRLLETGLRAGLPPRLTGGLADVVRDEVTARGVGTLWRGVGINVVRGALIHTGTLPVYEHTKFVARTSLGATDSPSLHVAAGLVAGLVGTTISMPLDVIRTRIFQLRAAAAASGGRAAATTTAAQAAVDVWREGGALGFFRGWGAAYVRLGPILVFYPALLEQVRKRVFGLDYIK